MGKMSLQLGLQLPLSLVTVLYTKVVLRCRRHNSQFNLLNCIELADLLLLVAACRLLLDGKRVRLLLLL